MKDEELTGCPRPMFIFHVASCALHLALWIRSGTDSVQVKQARLVVGLLVSPSSRYPPSSGANF